MLRRPNTVDFEALYAALPAGPTVSLEGYVAALSTEEPEACKAAMPPPAEIPKKALQALEQPAPEAHPRVLPTVTLTWKADWMSQTRSLRSS